MRSPFLIGNQVHGQSSTIWFVMTICVIALSGATPLHAKEKPDHENTLPTTSSDVADPQVTENLDGDDALDDITKLSLEALTQVEVTSVSRRAGQKLFDAPAAVTVISQEDIRRTGHQHLAEIMRLVPGMHVGRLDASKWAVSSRGFSDEFNSMQLVQIDGRTIYTPLFAGVFWNMHDAVLEDLDRVEAIRGPGATQWGANAVNGVINFTTKDAKDTQGLLVSGGGGTLEGGFGTVRYGGKINDEIHYRVYSKLQEHQQTDHNHPNYSDDWLRWQAGARFDWQAEDGKDHVTWQGDVANVERAGASFISPNLPLGTAPDVDDNEHFDNWNALARWTHDFGADNQMQLQAYYDVFRARRPHGSQNQGSVLRARHDTLDLDFQHSMKVGHMQRIVYGVNYRMVDFEFQNGWALKVDPTGRVTHTVSGFFQDTLSLIDEKLELTIGTKMEHNPYTGFEIQPSVKLLYKPHQDHVLWWSGSRAVRVPYLAENDLAQLPVAVLFPNTSVDLVGNRDLDTESLYSIEMGYRTQPLKWFSVDMAGYYNMFRDLIGTKNNARPVPLPPFQQFENEELADAAGVELSANIQPFERWRITANYSFQWLNGPNSFDINASPEHQFHIRSYLDIRDDLELNAAVYYVGHITGVDIPEYLRTDLGLTWRPHKHLELSIWGQNLTESQHMEYRFQPTVSHARGEIPRSVYGQLTFRW